MDLDIKGKTAIVVASSKGIGKAVALKLALEGVNVTICAREKEQLEKARDEIESLTGSRVLAVSADITKPDQVKKVVHMTLSKFGSVEILVNNCGGPPTGPFLNFTDEDWYNALDLILLSVVRFSREVISYMKTKKWGRIINLTSFTVKQPLVNFVLSNAIRLAVVGLTKTLAIELAEDGILVNGVSQGYTLTGRIDEIIRMESTLTNRPCEEILKKIEREIPLRRLAKPEEIADLVAFLASNRASYITGVNISVDGGLVRGIF